MKRNTLSRRSILLSGASFLGSGLWGWQGLCAFSEESLPPVFSEIQRYSLQEALQKADGQYDPQAKMILSSVSGVGYHTTLKEGNVHPTRTSLEYAVALLDSGEADRLERAKDIVKTVIALQDQQPSRNTYGIWPWYLEEPLEKMSPPDWNWADFCGVQLLAAWIDHRTRLGEEIANAVKESIIHAATSIQRRNVSLGYTNIAIMGTYVTLVAGERFNLPLLQKYAKERLRLFHRYLMDQGSFNEYNSPTYTVVVLKELSRMLMHVRDEEDRKRIRDIHDRAWKHAACRFHGSTRQWAGPHSRCYSTLLQKETLTLLEVATGGQQRVLTERPLALGLGDYRLTLQCPEENYPYFPPGKEPRTITEKFLKHVNPDLNIIGTTYLHPKYALGTVNRGDFWNQRRPFLAYWGTQDKPTYLQLRFLHDGYDFCSAMPFTVQHQGCALTGIVFATDYGDTHPSLDRVVNATIRAKDLRLRFEIGGNIDELNFVPFNGPEGMVFMRDREMQIMVRPLVDPFDGQRFQWEIGGNKEIKWIDAIAYSGKEKEIPLASLQASFILFALQFCTAEGKPFAMNSIDLQEEKGWQRAIWKFSDPSPTPGTQTRSIELTMEIPILPGKCEDLYKAFQKIQKKIIG